MILVLPTLIFNLLRLRPTDKFNVSDRKKNMKAVLYKIKSRRHSSADCTKITKKNFLKFNNADKKKVPKMSQNIFFSCTMGYGKFLEGNPEKYGCSCSVILEWNDFLVISFYFFLLIKP